MDHRKSIFGLLGIPEPFGVLLLSVSLVFCLAPYLSGADFGFLRIPDLGSHTTRVLKWLGPPLLLGLCLLFVPFIKTSGTLSILRPVNNQVLALRDDMAWILEGKFPRITDRGTPRIAVVVKRLADGKDVPQNGVPEISTAKGIWRYESAHFTGPGDYKIKVDASINGWQDQSFVVVKCLPKAEALQMAVDKDRKLRNPAAFPFVVPKVVPPLREAKTQLYQLQNEFFQSFESDPPQKEKALKATDKALDLVALVLPSYPDDVYLQDSLAYTQKNRAMVLRVLNRPQEADRSLGEAERMFEVIRQQNPNDASAWNGLGSIALLRNDPSKALVYIDRALALDPNYKAAIHDRGIALEMQRQQR